MHIAMFVPYLVWMAFTLLAVFAVIYKAAMAAGSELHPFSTVRGYFSAKPLTTIMRFILAQIFYFAVVQNPALLGSFFVGSALDGVKASPLILAGLLGLSSDKGADIIIVVGTWLYNKVTKAFS
jgi:hypothetical protein